MAAEADGRLFTLRGYLNLDPVLFRCGFRFRHNPFHREPVVVLPVLPGPEDVECVIAHSPLYTDGLVADVPALGLFGYGMVEFGPFPCSSFCFCHK